VYLFCKLCKATALLSNACWICGTLDEDVLGKILGDTLFKMLGTGESLAELNEVSGRLGDELLTTV
jgi:hypothetical protein